MAAYFQMGHDSENLVGIDGLESFKGLVLSPVNRGPTELMASIKKFRKQGDLDVIFDPQLYFPRAKRGELINQPYFSLDLDTADLSSEAWWRTKISAIVEYSVELGVDAVCSPLILPSNNKWTESYYVHAVSNFKVLKDRLSGFGPRPVMTLIVNWDQMDDVGEALRIASIATQHEAPQWVYLIVEAPIPPRRELADDQRLLALMALISALEGAGCKVLVSHCSSEVVLLKAAGASHCATGKFFNLRRFSRSRFDDDEEVGGRQVPYWFEHGMLGFLREADIRRIQLNEALKDVIGSGHSANQFSSEILGAFAVSFSIKERPKWLGLSWRQYLAWFAKVESDLSDSNRMKKAQDWTRKADEVWEEIESQQLLLDERHNDGNWVRAWRQALNAFERLT